MPPLALLPLIYKLKDYKIHMFQLYWGEVFTAFFYQADSAGPEKVMMRERWISPNLVRWPGSFNNHNLQTFKHSAMFFDARIGAPC